MVEDGFALKSLLVRVVDVTRKVAGDLDVLLVRIGANPLVSLEEILLFEGIGIEVDPAQGFDQYIGELRHP